MKKLLLLRHAKSSWKDPDLEDFDRPLNERGRKATETLGKHIAKEEIPIDLIISSPAVRARETIERVLKAAKRTPAIRFDRRVYEATPDRLLTIVAEIEDDPNSLMLVGHNPGMEELLGMLVGREQHMPTACLAGVSLNIKKWEKITITGGSLDFFTKARDLEL